MKNKHLLLLLYVGLVCAYAGWQGNANALTEKVWHNSKGELVFPTVVRKAEEASALGSSLYYTGADGQRYIDIQESGIAHFNWAEFWRISTFGIGFLLLVLLIITLWNTFSNQAPLSKQ